MTSKRIRNVLKKEWEVLFSDLNNTLFVTLLPLLIVAQGLGYIWLINHFGAGSIMETSVFQDALIKLRAAIPATQSLSLSQQAQALLLNQFNFFLLLIPTMIAISFATFSIVEEKQTHTLEPLLATPVRTWELLMGKALSGAIPALIVTWVCAVLFLAGVSIMGWGNLINIVLTPAWYITLFLLTPAVAVLSFLLGVIGSSRAKDAKGAQNLVMAIIFPVFALIGLQVTGVVWFTARLTLALVLLLCVIDLQVLRLAVRLFQRESIVVKWR